MRPINGLRPITPPLKQPASYKQENSEAHSDESKPLAKDPDGPQTKPSQKLTPSAEETKGKGIIGEVIPKTIGRFSEPEPVILTDSAPVKRADKGSSQSFVGTGMLKDIIKDADSLPRKTLNKSFDNYQNVPAKSTHPSRAYVTKMPHSIPAKFFKPPQMPSSPKGK